MTFPATTRPVALRAVVSGVALVVGGGCLVGSRQLLPSAGVASIVAAAVIAYRGPVSAAMAVLLISSGHRIFANSTTLSGICLAGVMLAAPRQPLGESGDD